MSLCEDCQKVSLTRLREQDIALKEDLATLILSAQNGCTFCTMCWTRLQQDCNVNTINMHLKEEWTEPSADRKVWLNLWLHEDGTHKFVNGDGSHILVSSGRFTTRVNEPGTGTTLYSRLSLFADPGKHEDNHSHLRPSSLVASRQQGSKASSRKILYGVAKPRSAYKMDKGNAIGLSEESPSLWWLQRSNHAYPRHRLGLLTRQV